MKILIIEDEIQARRSLKKLIKLVNPENNIVFESGRVDNAIKYLNIHDVDLVFLDLELEDGTGFDLLNAFPKRRFKVIITTAFDNKAIEAYRSNAMDYLLKPISPYDLTAAVERVTEQLKIEALAKNLEEKLSLKTTNAFIQIAPTDIIRLEANGAYTQFFTKNKNFVVSRHLLYYENILGSSFIRVHQSHLVRLDQIKNVNGKELFLNNGEVIPISTRKKQLVIKKLL